MKKLLVCLVALFALTLALLAPGLPASLQAQQGENLSTDFPEAGTPDRAAIEDETLRHFQALLRFDTSDPPVTARCR